MEYHVFWVRKRSCFELFRDRKYGLFYLKSWWKVDIFLVFLNFSWYSRTWEIWFFVRWKEFAGTYRNPVTLLIVNTLMDIWYWLRIFRRAPFIVSSCFYLHNHLGSFLSCCKLWQNNFQFRVLEWWNYGKEHFSELSI